MSDKCEACGGSGFNLQTLDGAADAPLVTVFFRCKTCKRFPDDDAEREYILLCVSAHDDLLAACRSARGELIDRGREGGVLGEILRDAIAKGKGSSECPTKASFPSGASGS